MPDEQIKKDNELSQIIISNIDKIIKRNKARLNLDIQSARERLAVQK